MLGSSTLSELPLSSQASATAAVFAMVGAGQFSPVGAASGVSVLSAVGAGTFAPTGAASARAELSIAGSADVQWPALASGAATFSIVGAASYTAYGEPIYRTPIYRTAVVPRVDRVLVLAARNRIQDVPAPSRVEMVIASPPRVAMVPALGNTIEAG